MIYDSSGYCFQCRHLSTYLKETVSNIPTFVCSLDVELLLNIEAVRVSCVRTHY